VLQVAHEEAVRQTVPLQRRGDPMGAAEALGEDHGVEPEGVGVRPRDDVVLAVERLTVMIGQSSPRG